MTTATATARDVRHWHRPLLVLTVVMAVLAAITAVAIFADPRVLTGMPIWVKPFKFAVSLGVYGFTLAWTLSVLPRRSRVAEWAATVIVAAASIEIVVIVTQAIRGTTSHYNETSALNSALWQSMGSSIMVLFAAHFVIAVIVLRRRIADRASAYAIRLGLGLALLGMLAAVPMVMPPGASFGQAHTVGLPDGGPGLPLVGWSTVGGDLRIGHFVGLHGLQALPLLALLLDRFFATRLTVVTRARLLLVAGPAYAILVVMLTWQALRAQPLLQPDALTLTAWTALALVTAAAATTVVVRGRRSELALAA